MNKEGNNIISDMLDGMGHDSLSCDSGFYNGVKDRIAERIVQRKRTERRGYISLLLLLILSVFNVVSVANVVRENDVDDSIDNISYLYLSEQDSRDVYWMEKIAGSGQ